MSIADGFNAWVGFQLIPSLIVFGAMLAMYGVFYLILFSRWPKWLRNMFRRRK